ncbi:hypothetical protein J6590_052981 [Homalodisca vitripennis]|nr:hypothetical protein J6590_052981 [Homalodisca vitripennis]
MPQRRLYTKSLQATMDQGREGIHETMFVLVPAASRLSSPLTDRNCSGKSCSFLLPCGSDVQAGDREVTRPNACSGPEQPRSTLRSRPLRVPQPEAVTGMGRCDTRFGTVSEDTGSDIRTSGIS